MSRVTIGEITEDGTLTVHVSDGSKVNRVFVMGDNIFGGLYYPDSAENKGEWISTEDRPDGFCSKCDHDIAEAPTPYCPYCGAKMTWVGAIHEPYKKGE